MVMFRLAALKGERISKHGEINESFMVRHRALLHVVSKIQAGRLGWEDCGFVTMVIVEG